MAALDPHAALGAAKVGPGRALPQVPGPPAPHGVGGELPLSAGGGVDAAGRMGSHAGRCAPPPGSPHPQPPRAPGPPVCPQAPAGDPPGDAARRHTPVGHHPKPNPAPAHKRRRTDTGGTDTGGPPPPPRHAAPTGHAGQRDSVGPPHPHTRAHSTWVADPNSPPSGRAVGGGTAPDRRRPSQWWKAPPQGTPFRHPQSEQRQPARAHAVGPVLGPHARTDRTQEERGAEPWLHAPEDGRPGEGQRLTPDAPHNGGRPPPPLGTPPTTPAACSPHRACRPRGQCWTPTPTHPRPQHVGCGPQQPAQWASSWGRDSA